MRFLPRARRSLLAAHRPPDEEQHQREHAARLGKKDPAVVHARDSSPAVGAADRAADRAPARCLPASSALLLAAVLFAGCAAPRGPGHAQPIAADTARTMTTTTATATAATTATATAAASATTATAADVLRVDELPGWREDAFERLHEALSRQCALARPPEPWSSLCAELPPAPELKAWVARRFVARPLVREDRGPGLLTGYYEPVVTGSRRREHAGQAPLYRRPADLVGGPGGTRLRAQAGSPDPAQRTALAPYPTRAQIETGQLLAGQELVWIDDRVEAFFLHVQGSGRVRLRDGSELRVGFADHNGQPYHAIGRELVARGALAGGAADADAIKAWLRANPGEADAVMRTNRRYVFFREMPAGDGGPPGALGVPLTPMRSVATDPAHVPPGALLFLDSTHPDGGAPLRRLVVSQDRGAAIVGPVRADLFWGSGDEAGRLAGRTKQPARIWLLTPRPAGDASPGAARPPALSPSLSPSSTRPASG